MDVFLYIVDIVLSEKAPVTYPPRAALSSWGIVIYYLHEGFYYYVSLPRKIEAGVRAEESLL